MHAIVYANERLFVRFLEIVWILCNLLLELLLDVVAHKVRARIAVDAMAVEDAKEYLVRVVAELPYDLEGILVRLTSRARERERWAQENVEPSSCHAHKAALPDSPVVQARVPTDCARGCGRTL